MCNHYLQDPDVMEWAQSVVPGVVIPEALPEIPEHTYPKRPAPVVTQNDGVRSLEAIRWGVWPFYKREKPQYVTNARSDGLLSKAVWKASARKRRCLIPAMGYYEPGLGPVGAKGEILFKVKERPKFFFAGLWDVDPDKSGNRGFTMVTTEPNDYVRPFHDRMPVVLEEGAALDWLGEEPLSDGRLLELCRGLPSEALLYEELPAKLKIIRPEKKAPADDQNLLF